MHPEPQRLRRALLKAALLLAGGAATAATKVDRNDARLVTSDLAADAARLPADGVLLLLFSLPDCHWCHEVRQSYLLPLGRDAAASTGLAIRELSLVAEPLRGFDGQPVAIETLARRWSVKAAPTLLFLDRCGEPLAEALVGGDVAGFYGAYFDRALAAARRAAAERLPGC
jgi:hypothetical protein